VIILFSTVKRCGQGEKPGLKRKTSKASVQNLSFSSLFTHSFLRDLHEGNPAVSRLSDGFARTHSPYCYYY